MKLSDKRHWILGVALALVGVALARLVAPSVASGRIAWTLIGHALALSGLMAIALGTRRKYLEAARRAAERRE